MWNKKLTLIQWLYCFCLWCLLVGYDYFLINNYCLEFTVGKIWSRPWSYPFRPSGWPFKVIFAVQSHLFPTRPLPYTSTQIKVNAEYIICIILLTIQSYINILCVCLCYYVAMVSRFLFRSWKKPQPVQPQKAVGSQNVVMNLIVRFASNYYLNLWQLLVATPFVARAYFRQWTVVSDLDFLWFSCKFIVVLCFADPCTKYYRQ